jgi:hypothetical protein
MNFQMESANKKVVAYMSYDIDGYYLHRCRWHDDISTIYFHGLVDESDLSE